MRGTADGPSVWRVIVDAGCTPAWNMAVDEALAHELEPDTAVLRLYEWSGPTVSLGRNQPARNRYDLDRAARGGIEFVRRPTGGRAVLHDRELTYAAVLPDSAFGGPRAIYGRVQRALAHALCDAGAKAQQEPLSEAGAPRPSTQPCFGVALPGEVTLDGRKVVGSAQARVSGAVLQHGAILLLNDQSLLPELLISPPGSMDASEQPSQANPRPTTLAEVGVGLSPTDLAGHVWRAFARTLPGRFECGDLAHKERRRAESLVGRYASAEWTWRY